MNKGSYSCGDILNGLIISCAYMPLIMLLFPLLSPLTSSICQVQPSRTLSRSHVVLGIVFMDSASHPIHPLNLVHLHPSLSLVMHLHQVKSNSHERFQMPMHQLENYLQLVQSCSTSVSRTSQPSFTFKIRDKTGALQPSFPPNAQIAIKDQVQDMPSPSFT